VKAVEAISEIISKNDIIPEPFILTKVSAWEPCCLNTEEKTLLIDDGPKKLESWPTRCFAFTE
jgi:hypothetical protein